MSSVREESSLLHRAHLNHAHRTLSHRTHLFTVERLFFNTIMHVFERQHCRPRPQKAWTSLSTILRGTFFGLHSFVRKQNATAVLARKYMVCTLTGKTFPLIHPFSRRTASNRSIHAFTVSCIIFSTQDTGDGSGSTYRLRRCISTPPEPIFHARYLHGWNSVGA